MAYSITRHIIPKKQRRFNKFPLVIIWVISIPVIIIAALSILIYLAFLRMVSLFSKRKDHEDIPYHLELELLNNEHVRIILTEDETDSELTLLNEKWVSSVYKEETSLYRIKTIPNIKAIDGKICCFYLKQQSEGVILQVLDHSKKEDLFSLNTILILLNFPSLDISPIANVGAYYLYNDENNQNVIKGFNEKENIEIYLFKV